MFVSKTSTATIYYDDNSNAHNEKGPAYISHTSDFSQWFFHGEVIAYIYGESICGGEKKKFNAVVINSDGSEVRKVYYEYDKAYDICQSYFLRLIKLKAFI